MSSIAVARGNYVVITTSFLDENNSPVSPVGTPTISFSWVATLAPVVVNMSPTGDPSVWTIKWDTSVVTSTKLDWSVKAEASAGLFLVENGTIVVEGNLANR